MEKEIENKLFELLFIRSMKYDDVVKELNFPIQLIREYYNRMTKTDEVVKLRRLRSLYDNKKNNKDYNLGDFFTFYKWYLKQESIQNCKCYYCGTDEFKIRELVKSGLYKKSKQMTNRGRHLEIERKDSKNNDYSPQNCVLACYFCNNDKSDVITEDDYFKYFVNEKPSSRKRYVDDKYSELIKKKK